MYVVGTPIGNLEDVTLRALRVLGEVDLVAAEDTRLTRRLLSRHGLDTPLVSFHEHTTPGRREGIVRRLDDENIALVTDAGTPGVSDPGAALVADALAAGHDVVAVPGPSAVSTALSVSGLAADSYVFVGFLPRRGKDRRAALASVQGETRTLVAFESPHRLRECLADAHAVLGDRPAAVARELTKRFEEVWRGSLADAHAYWAQVEPRGEFTLVIGGAPDAVVEPWTDDAVRTALQALRAEGLGAKDAARHLSGQAGRPSREIYRLWPHDA